MLATASKTSKDFYEPNTMSKGAGDLADQLRAEAEEKEDLKDVLEDELYTLLRVTSLMKPKNDVEFIAVALPNLHLKVFELIAAAEQRGAERERVRYLSVFDDVR